MCSNGISHFRSTSVDPEEHRQTSRRSLAIGGGNRFIAWLPIEVLSCGEMRFPLPYGKCISEGVLPYILGIWFLSHSQSHDK